ncbi:hypothetical protein BJ741DRAFT_610736 [Chytriomyces cf. hyalinus JEL632]|nr:hypothetical protein BJ741DRAFT_610736 [Chytriomyces cf. hyalinus JEL632]
MAPLFTIHLFLSLFSLPLAITAFVRCSIIHRPDIFAGSPRTIDRRCRFVQLGLVSKVLFLRSKLWKLGHHEGKQECNNPGRQHQVAH